MNITCIYCLHEVQQGQKLSLQLGKNNPMHQYMLGVDQLGSSLKIFCIKRCVGLGGHCIEYESAAKSLQ